MRYENLQCKSGRLTQNGKRVECRKRKEWQKIENAPRPEMGKKWCKSGKKIEKMVPKPIVSPFLGHFSLFLFFGYFLPIFGFWPVFHSIPGGLTRKTYASEEFIRTQLESVSHSKCVRASFGEINRKKKKKNQMSTYSLSIKLRSPPPKSVNFEGFPLIFSCTIFPHLGLFSGEGFSQI